MPDLCDMPTVAGVTCAPADLPGRDTPGPSPGPSGDGRGPAGSTPAPGARRTRTREAVVTAMLELISEGDLRPRGKAIAARADVSLRTLYHHFDDLDDLMSEAVARVFTDMDGRTDELRTDRPVEVRIRDFVESRAETLEVVIRFWMALLVASQSSEVLRAHSDRGREWVRARVAEQFDAELSRLPADDAAVLLDALIVPVSAPAWHLLRTENGMPVERAKKVMELALRALLGVR